MGVGTGVVAKKKFPRWPPHVFQIWARILSRQPGDIKSTSHFGLGPLDEDITCMLFKHGHYMSQYNGFGGGCNICTVNVDTFWW